MKTSDWASRGKLPGKAHGFLGNGRSMRMQRKQPRLRKGTSCMAWTSSAEWR